MYNIGLNDSPLAIALYAGFLVLLWGNSRQVLFPSFKSYKSRIRQFAYGTHTDTDTDTDMGTGYGKIRLETYFGCIRNFGDPSLYSKVKKKGRRRKGRKKTPNLLRLGLLLMPVLFFSFSYILFFSHLELGDAQRKGLHSFFFIRRVESGDAERKRESIPPFIKERSTGHKTSVFLSFINMGYCATQSAHSSSIFISFFYAELLSSEAHLIKNLIHTVGLAMFEALSPKLK